MLYGTGLSICVVLSMVIARQLGRVCVNLFTTQGTQAPVINHTVIHLPDIFAFMKF